MEDKSITILKVTVDQEVTYKRIQDLLCCALEGGSNYWYTITDFIEPKELVIRSFNGEVFRHLDYPVNVGGALMIGDKEDDEAPAKILNRETIEKGIKVMATKYPRHFGDFMQENDDADTGDCFLQCCLFGEMIYG